MSRRYGRMDTVSRLHSIGGPDLAIRYLEIREETRRRMEREAREREAEEREREARAREREARARERDAEPNPLELLRRFVNTKDAQSVDDNELALRFFNGSKPPWTR